MASQIRKFAPVARQFGSMQLRSFSVTAARDAQYGFIGLGQMGMFIILRSINNKSEANSIIRI